MESREPDAPLPTDFPPAARIYLRPVGPSRRADLAALIDRGEALPLAGGDLAFGLCEVAIRLPGPIRRVTAALPDIRAWAARAGGTLRERVEGLLGHLSRGRCDPRGELLGRPLLMGIVNATPDSFSDGGLHVDPAAAVAHGRRLAEAGADIIDVGGESTRPGAAPVAPDIETARVLLVLQGLAAAPMRLPKPQLSIDTRHASVMRAALAVGVDVINDVSALTDDPASLEVAAGSRAAVVLMHMRGTPSTMNEAPVYDDAAFDVFDELEARVQACLDAGIGRHRIIVDPGIGFGKRRAHNLAILRSLALYHGLGCPLLLGVSRKSLGEGDGRVAPKDRLPTSLAAAMHALNQGVQILRVHDVAETHRIVDFWQQLTAGGVDH